MLSLAFAGRLLAASGLVVYCFAAANPAGIRPEDLMEHGHWKRARAGVEQLYRAGPSDARANHLMSRVYMSWDQYGPGLRYAEKSVALDGQVADYRVHLAHVNGQILDDAPLWKQYGLVKTFKRSLDEAMALDPHHPDVLLIKATFLAAAPAFVGGDKQQSEATLNQLVRLNPERGYLARGRMARRQKDWAAADAAYRKALVINPQSLRARVGLATLHSVYETEPKWDLAERDGRELIRFAPDHAAGYRAVAAAYAAWQRWTDLDAVVEQAQRAVPDDLSPLYEAARVLEESGKDLPRAERYLKQYLAQEAEGGEPTHAEAQRLLGLTLEKSGRKAEAIAALEAALRLQPNFELARKELGRLR